jgi:hypothetical protein
VSVLDVPEFGLQYRGQLYRLRLRVVSTGFEQEADVSGDTGQLFGLPLDDVRVLLGRHVVGQFRL